MHVVQTSKPQFHDETMNVPEIGTVEMVCRWSRPTLCLPARHHTQPPGHGTGAKLSCSMDTLCNIPACALEDACRRCRDARTAPPESTDDSMEVAV